MRQVYRLLGLARRYGPGPVDTACQRALDLDVINVTKIASMLEKATENTPVPPRPAAAATARFARDPAEYRPVQLTLIPGGKSRPVTTVIRDAVSPDLRATLRALKLGQMLDTLPERLTLARQQKMADADFLELVLADEVTRREAKSAGLRARAAAPGRQDAAGRLGRVRGGPLRPAVVERADLAAVPRRPARRPHPRPRRGGQDPSGQCPRAHRGPGGAAPCTWPPPRSCSSGSKPPGWTTP